VRQKIDRWNKFATDKTSRKWILQKCIFIIHSVLRSDGVGASPSPSPRLPKVRLSHEREEGRGKREEGRGKREEGRGKEFNLDNVTYTSHLLI
jgi:hypothetical protein